VVILNPDDRKPQDTSRYLAADDPCLKCALFVAIAVGAGRLGSIAAGMEDPRVGDAGRTCSMRQSGGEFEVGIHAARRVARGDQHRGRGGVPQACQQSRAPAR
jgi:hypothetical protein